jgi:hypothetical protein
VFGQPYYCHVDSGRYFFFGELPNHYTKGVPLATKR